MSMKKSFKFNADCANCANEMETVANNTDGVKKAVVNFMTLKMTVEFEDGQDYPLWKMFVSVAEKLMMNAKFSCD